MFRRHLLSIFHGLTLPLYHEAADAGAGSGGTGSSAGAAGSGTAAPGSGGQGPAGGSGRASAGQQSTGQQGQGQQAQGQTGQQTGTGTTGDFEFRDDARYRMQDGRVLTGAQVKQELSDAAEQSHRTRYQRGYDMLLNEARRLDSLRGGRQGQQPQGQQVDPLAEVEQMPTVDGKTLASLYRQLETAGLRPIADLVANMQRELQTLKGTVGQYGQRFGSQDEEQEQSRFHQTLDQTLANVKIQGLSGPIDAKNEAVRTIAENLHLSYVPGSWRAGEYEKMLGEQLNGLFNYFREALKNEGTVARENLRRNFNVNRGGGSPSGGSQYKFQSPREIAAAAREAGMFSGART